MSLQNSYYILRHGESEANVSGLIISAPENGVSRYGLTEKGKAMVEKSITGASFTSPISKIISSDFKRAMETARIAAGLLGTGAPQVNFLLRERFFGDLEGKSSDAYPQVWEKDRKDPDNSALGVESPRELAARITRLFRSLENTFTDEVILLVSHGDTLQIMQTITSGSEAHHHRAIQHIHPGELRHLEISETFISRIKESS